MSRQILSVPQTQQIELLYPPHIYPSNPHNRTLEAHVTRLTPLSSPPSTPAMPGPPPFLLPVSCLPPPPSFHTATTSLAVHLVYNPHCQQAKPLTALLFMGWQGGCGGSGIDMWGRVIKVQFIEFGVYSGNKILYGVDLSNLPMKIPSA